MRIYYEKMQNHYIYKITKCEYSPICAIAQLVRLDNARLMLLLNGGLNGRATSP